MSEKKLCRLCLNAVFSVPTSVSVSGVNTKQILTTIFPGLNTSLTTSLTLCEECFNNVNFAHRVKESFKEKEREFSKTKYYGSFCKRKYCSLCFRFETKDVIFLHKNNYSNESFKHIIDITLSESKVINDDTNICCICWSWIKKIYSFKKRCFKVEESLRVYCLEMGFQILTDRNLEEFLYKQYCIRSTNSLPCYSSENNVNTADLNKLNLSQGEGVNLESSPSLENEYDEIEIKYNDPTDTSQSDSTGTVTNITNAENANTITHDTLDEIDADDEFDERVERKLDNNFIVISDEEDDNPKLNTIPNKDSDEVICIDLSENNASNMGKTPINMDSDFDTDSQNEQNTLHRNDTSFGNKNSTVQNTDFVSNNKRKLNNSNNLNNSILKNITKDHQRKKCSSSIKSNTENTSLQITLNDVSAETLVDLTCNNLQVIYCGTSEFSKIYQSCKEKSDASLQNPQNKEDQIKSVESIFHNKIVDIIPFTSNINSDTHFVDCNKNSSLCSNKMNNFPNTSDDDDDDECIIINEDIVISNSQQSVEDTGLLEKDEDCFEIVNATCDLNEACDAMETQTVENSSRKKSTDLKSYDVWGCHICVAKFIDKGKIRKHMMSHEEPWNKYGRFQCKKCPFRASWKGSVTRHKTLHTKANLIKYFGKKLRYFCPYCSTTYDVKEAIQAHINEHVVSWSKFQCGDCMFSSNNSEALRSHYSKNHTKAKDPTFSPTVNWEAAYQYLTEN